MKNTYQFFAGFLGFILIAGLLVSCTPGTELLNRVPVHSVDFKVLDQNGNPIQGATVEASNSKTTSTNESGIATLKFGAVGVHNVRVMAPEYMPTIMTVTLPTDNNEVKTARLAKQVDYSQMIGAGFSQMGASQMYPMMFSYMFNSFGYNMELTDYEPGEWTKWEITTSGDEEEGVIFKKAFLRENDEGQQWWQLQMFQESDESAQYTAELLFDENRSSILRYREKMGDSEIQEKPVTENWYSQPNQLTEESIEGALEQENVEITVPKGSFSSDLINFGVAPEMHLKIWRVTKIPGGVVKYATEEGEEIVYESQLVDYGSDADTILNSY